MQMRIRRTSTFAAEKKSRCERRLGARCNKRTGRLPKISLDYTKHGLMEKLRVASLLQNVLNTDISGVLVKTLPSDSVRLLELRLQSVRLQLVVHVISATLAISWMLRKFFQLLLPWRYTRNEFFILPEIGFPEWCHSKISTFKLLPVANIASWHSKLGVFVDDFALKSFLFEVFGPPNPGLGQSAHCLLYSSKT